ncbi:MAG: translocation/assembly module TamB domain-containing protein [Crocinitomicaceae bacterium]|nr:translocation/assembly module TamB domain-containing protein [Crocinitomicaceae bacterium]
MAHQASAYFTNEFGSEVYIDKVDIKFFNRVDLEGVYLEDLRKDTFIYANVIHADIGDWSLKKSFLDISTVTLEDGHIHMRQYKGDSTLNFQHIVDYFATEEEDTTSSEFEVSVASIQLKDMHFIMDDENSEPSPNGMDFSHIDLQHLNGGFSKFNMLGEKIIITLDNLSFVDKSGLALNKLSGDLSIDPQLISLSNLEIGLNQTYIKGDYLNFETPNGAMDWAEFLNKVSINSHLSGTRLRLEDLAYFVPDLWGLKGDILINNMETKGSVYGMKIKDVDIQILDTTRIKGDFEIPNLSDPSSAFFEEDLHLFRTSISDVEKMGLENILDERGQEALNNTLEQYAQANVIELTDGSMIGYIQSFVVDGKLNSGIGKVDLNYGLKFKWNELDSMYYYSGGKDLDYGNIVVTDLNMGVISGSDVLSKVSGSVYVSGKGFDEQSLDISFHGGLKKVGVMGYDYSGVTVKRGNFTNNKFDGEITIDDQNLALKYDGSVDLKAPMKFDFVVRIDSAKLDELTLKEKELYQRLSSKVTVKITGTDVNKFHGTVLVEDLEYRDSVVDIKMDRMTLDVTRHPDNDSILLTSPYVDMNLYGKYDLNDIGHALTEQFSYVMSNIVEDQYAEKAGKEHFELYVNLKDTDELLKFYDTGIKVAHGTEIRSEYGHAKKTFVLKLNSEFVQYGDMRFEEIVLDNDFDSTKAVLNYTVEHIQVTDSLAVREFQFDSRIEDNTFVTLTGWDGLEKTEPALFAFESAVSKNHDILTTFRPSFFFLKGNQYEVKSSSSVLYNKEKLVFKDFKISHSDDYLGLEGIVSRNPDDWLNITVHNFDLSDLNGIIGESLELQGILNMRGQLANVYDTPKFQAESTIDGLTMNRNEVGDISLLSQYDESSNSVFAQGDLRRERMKTFSFKGMYYTDREKNNLNFTLDFDKTDIGFLKAFEDPELYTDIEGVLNGQLKVTGELDNPLVKGKMAITNSNVKVPMFNVAFGANGIISFADGEIIANHLMINDQEGNKADCQMFIYHYDWANWNYNILLDMDNPNLSKQFLAMDTKYKEGDYYYGKAYVSGMVDIFGYDDHTEIEVDLKTEKGTSLVLPMYGSSELEEGSFIVFDENYFEPDTSDENNNKKDKIERLGMTLSMKFEVTKKAEVKIVFDPVLEDQIISRGEGNIEINMDDFGDMTMYGEYVIRDGRYEMRIKQVVTEDFVLENGGTIQWTGSPYDAQINIKATFERNVSLADIMPPEAAESRKKELVYGVLEMGNTLMNPELRFNIQAPKTDDLGKKAINEIKADQDELNKQFFALLVLKRFLPKYGGAAGGGNAVLGLAETQINSVLSGVSENYDLKAGLTESSTTLGVETKLNDRTTINTSFGVISDDQGAGSGSIVGDVDIEYRLNDDGSFTMNFFNETNSSSITTQGNYTQGISLHYQETFNTTKQFKLWQKFLNIFRKKGNKVKFEPKENTNDKWVPLPEEESDTTSTGLIRTE